MWMFAGRCESEGLTGASLAGGDLFYDLQHVLALPLWALTWKWIHARTYAPLRSAAIPLLRSTQS